jgi:hypothetical protein
MSVYNHYRNQAEWWTSRCGYTMDDLPEPTPEDIAAYRRVATGELPSRMRWISHKPIGVPSVIQVRVERRLGLLRYEPPLEDTP